MRPISNPAFGLLSIFDLKQNARYPQEVSDNIALNFDLSILQLQSNTRVLTSVDEVLNGIGVVSTGAIAIGAGISVPNGEFWIATHVECQARLTNCSGASVYGIPQLVYNDPNSNVATPISNSAGDLLQATLVVPSSLATFYRSSQAINNYFLIPPGSSVSYFLPAEINNAFDPLGQVHFLSYLRYMPVSV